MNSGWLQLSAPYFLSVCHSVMDGYFISQGFTEIQSHSSSSVSYNRLGIIVKLGYLLETSPNYEIIAGVGFAQGGSIGLWRVIPSEAGSDAQAQNWRFRDQAELENVLSHIRDGAIDNFVRPLWDNPHLLKSLVEQQTKKTNAQFHREVVRQKKARAAAAFESRDFGLACSLYQEIDAYLLSSVETKRLQLSRKMLKNNAE